MKKNLERRKNIVTFTAATIHVSLLHYFLSFVYDRINNIPVYLVIYILMYFGEYFLVEKAYDKFIALNENKETESNGK